MINFENGELKSRCICEDCKNMDICRHADDMRHLAYDLPVKVEDIFSVQITCKRFEAKEAVR